MALTPLIKTFNKIFPPSLHMGIEFMDEKHLELRLNAFSKKNNLDSDDVLELLEKSSEIRVQFNSELYIHVSEFFRGIDIYLEIEQYCLPWLKTFNQINVWSLGCSKGEESVSIASWLDYHNLLKAARVYATDSSSAMIACAELAHYENKNIMRGSEAAKKLHKDLDFQKYFIQHKLAPRIRERISSFTHNALYDQSFAQMQLILCQNVFIYYNKIGQKRILQLMRASAMKGSFLILGRAEFIDDVTLKHFNMVRVTNTEAIYRFL